MCMGLTMSQRRAVTMQTGLRYKGACRAGKAVILDEWCALTGWHRDHARKALRPGQASGHDEAGVTKGTLTGVLKTRDFGVFSRARSTP